MSKGSDVDLWPPKLQYKFLTRLIFFCFSVEWREPARVISTFYDGLKNILQQHLLLEEGQSEISVAKQPLWLLFCCAGPLTRFSDKVASVQFDSSAMLETCRNQRRECVLLMCLCKLYAKRHILIWSYRWECKCRNGKWLKVSVYNDAWYSLFSCIISKKSTRFARCEASPHGQQSELQQ